MTAIDRIGGYLVGIVDDALVVDPFVRDRVCVARGGVGERQEQQHAREKDRAPPVVARRGRRSVILRSFDLPISRICVHLMSPSCGSMRAVLRAVRRNCRRMLRQIAPPRDEHHHIVQRGNRHHGYAERFLHFSHRRPLTLSAFHPIERNQHAGRLCTVRTKVAVWPLTASVPTPG